MRSCFLVAFVLLFGGCGIGLDHETQADFSGSPVTPTADSGSNWDDDPIPGSPAGSGSSSGPLKAGATSSGFRNTNFCKVDNSGNVTSVDTMNVTSGNTVFLKSGEEVKDVYDGLGGGCISRPIREVWAVVLNSQAIKSDKVTLAPPQAQPKLANPKMRTYFVYDLESTVRRLGGLFEIKWITQWYHTVTYGTYQAPNQIVVNFEKISGTSHVKYDKEGYTLDRVGPNMTSFTMRQTIKATQVDADTVKENIQEILRKVRNGTPDWTALPVTPP